MIYLEKGQKLADNPAFVVYNQTGYYNDGDSIVCAPAGLPDMPACSFEARFVAYGGLVYSISDEDELIAAIRKVDPKSLYGKNSEELAVDRTVNDIVAQEMGAIDNGLASSTPTTNNATTTATTTPSSNVSGSQNQNNATSTPSGSSADNINQAIETGTATSSPSTMSTTTPATSSYETNSATSTGSMSTTTPEIVPSAETSTTTQSIGGGHVNDVVFDDGVASTTSTTTPSIPLTSTASTSPASVSPSANLDTGNLPIGDFGTSTSAITPPQDTLIETGTTTSLAVPSPEPNPSVLDLGQSTTTVSE